ncbi:hypothetical protein FSP39_013370 [Pinctada imbricata]|uniref:Deleted in lung and esophageal cancer protein 1 Ig-like domain-containing protein n=1 Tax=Pinctada imbricata TaxID=66713 RepID=A0AA89CE01_PINIB|nr:hypothetical protein FSP39_013370 [Pinctada imbricata]
MKPPAAAGGKGEEPPMYLPRPSVAKSQDVRHILAKTFRDLYTRDTIGPDTVKNLSVSKGGDDPYHERYVESLQKIFDERQRRLDEAAKLERHIMQAQARAMSADEREINRMAKSCDNYGDLGLPPGRSHFRSCIDSDMLSKHKLLTPEDYATEEPAAVPAPSAPKIPSYARETVSSQQRIHTDSHKDIREQSPLHAIPQHSKSDIGAGPSFISEEGEILDEEGTTSPLLETVIDSTSHVIPQHGKSDIGACPGFISEEGEILDEEGTTSPLLETEVQGVPDWKLHLNETQREIDRTDLANLQAKVNFKRNPRHVPPSAPPGGRTLIKAHRPRPKEVGIEFKPELDVPMEPSLVFLVSPPEVVFKDYKVGQIYEITLELKNVSAVLRQCRALPPSSSYFSVGLGQFPGEHGLVAPGMSCHYAIRFAPDSLKDFDDEIRVQTQSTDPIIVPLRGRREPPKLSLPREIDVGYSLVGGYHVTQILIRNEGGPGRFCIIPRSSWPATNFKSVVVNGGVALPPFEIRPSVLELTKGQTGIMEVIFTPQSIKSYTQEMTIVCDNCHVRHFTLKGESQKAGVELVSVERGTEEVMPGELSDSSAQHLIRFDDLNPFTYTDRGVTIKNTTNVQLPFQWMIYKPDMTDSDDLDRKNERVPDVDSVFSVHPPTGTLPADGEIEFRVTFAPPVVNDFHSVLHLLLQQVPPYDEEGSAKSNKGDRKREGSLLIGDTEDDEETMSEIILNNDMKQFRDVTAMEVEVKGKSVSLNVVLHPYGIYVPGQNLLGTTVKKIVTMANHSRSTITFQWQPFHDKYILEVEPPFGELDPGMAMDLEMSITGTEPGKIEHTLYCYVMNLDEPLHLPVEAEFKGPEVTIDAADINFGLVRLGNMVEREITINNLSQMPTKWSLHDTTDYLFNPMAERDFRFIPEEGELKPLENKKVKIQFKPSSNKSINTVFELQVEEGNISNILVLAEVQSPTVCLYSCEICMEEVYKGVPVKYQAILVNQTLLATEFRWGPVEGSHRDDCSVELDIEKGILNPREEKVINVSFLANREGEFSDLRLPCVVEGINKPLYLGLFCEVKGISVKYRVSKERYGEFQDDLSLDYGEVELGKMPKIYLHLRNESAIVAPYTLNMDLFNAKPPTPPPGKNRETSGLVSQRRLMLGRTPNLADPMSKTPKKEQEDLCKAMLSQNHGVAFVPKSESGDTRLLPFGEEVIELTAYSDMWGNYTDNLVCKVGDLDPVSVPVSMNVKGCPLRFQMTTANQGLQPIVRFGTHVSGVVPVQRMMRINNISPFDIRTDWEVYNMEDNDTKLLDLTVAYGDPFPLRDESGNEIIPPWSVPAPPKRQPTDFIPNTPGTSAGSKREAPATPPKPRGKPSEEELMGGRRKVISLFYRAHDGNKADDPYSVKTSQLVVPARGTSSLHMFFSPFPTESVTKEMDCVGYALGFMSMTKDTAIENKVHRDQALAVDPLRLDMTAHIKPALLTIEPTDEEGMFYRSAMSDLLQAEGGTCRESLRVCSTMLSNQTETPLVFKLITKPPFLLVDLDPTSNKFSSTRSTETDYQTLRPQHNLLVKVAFQTTTDLLSRLTDDDATATDAEQDDDSKMDVEEGKKINVKEDLIIEFNNSASQRVPLCATVAVPQVELSKESLDFGTCLVGQRRELQLLVTNKTSSHTYWFAVLDSCSESCTLDTFSLDPTSGHLEAHITHISNSKTLLRVFFTAKHAEMYEGIFTFFGNLGERPRRLYIRGQGSYDGRHEAILNV